jgi:transcriptional regulator with XRE-family HTH domain
MFGKALRKLRIDRNLLLKDMADALGYSSAFLSAVEMGRKKIPADLIQRLETLYSLNPIEIESLRKAAEKSIADGASATRVFFTLVQI